MARSSAIDAGTDFNSVNTYHGGLSTNIAEDFWIDNISLVIPTGALYLFVAGPDSFYGDNSDPNGDYAVVINGVPEPSTALLLSLGCAGLSFVKPARGRRTGTSA